jgi:hypothetical protein
MVLHDSPFNLRAIIFVTGHDYQALFVLLGQVKGRTGCTVCVDDTVSSFLEGSRKVVYLGYKRSWWKDISTEVRSSTNFLMVSLSYILVQ